MTQSLRALAVKKCVCVWGGILSSNHQYLHKKLGVAELVWSPSIVPGGHGGISWPSVWLQVIKIHDLKRTWQRMTGQDPRRPPLTSEPACTCTQAH